MGKIKTLLKLIHHKRAELKCVLFGHNWDSEFEPNKKLENGTKSRTYCTRCGVKYHKSEYKK